MRNYLTVIRRIHRVIALGVLLLMASRTPVACALEDGQPKIEQTRNAVNPGASEPTLLELLIRGKRPQATDVDSVDQANVVDNHSRVTYLRHETSLTHETARFAESNELGSGDELCRNVKCAHQGESAELAKQCSAIEDNDGPKRIPLTIIDTLPSRAMEEESSSSTALPVIELPVDGDLYPIDLATAFRLAGASNFQIKLAREQVCEALARLKAAKVQWIPSLIAGLGFNHHDGRIQDTVGTVLEVSRSSAFAGGGAVVDGFPLAGGSNGPLRLTVDLSLANAFFDPLAAQQDVRAFAAARSSRFNDILLQVAIAYLELSRAQSQMAIALTSETNAKELLRLTEAQEKAKVGLRADVERSRSELAARRRQALAAEERMGVASAHLTQLLSLDPCVTLVAQEVHPVPLDIFGPQDCLSDLIRQGIASRPEHFEARARVRETYERKRQENLRPWLPNIHVGYGGGTFAGGPGSFIGNNGGRGDFDVQAVWQLQNAGFGTQAMRLGAISRHRQARLVECSVRDEIAAEVSATYHQVKSRRRQVAVTGQQVQAAAAALPLNLRGIIGRQLRAIEAQQAIQSLDSAFNEHLDAIVGYNQAQFGLLRAVGVPPNEGAVADELPIE